MQADGGSFAQPPAQQQLADRETLPHTLPHSGSQTDVSSALSNAVDVAVFNPLREALTAVWNKTRGTVRVDLVRPTFPPYKGGNLFVSRPTNHRSPAHRPAFQSRVGGGRVRRGEDGYDDYEREDTAGMASSFRRLTNLHRTGARFKIMRHVDIGPKMEGSMELGRRMFDVGVGLTFEMDTSQLQPLARLKVLDSVSLKLLPTPTFKFQKTWNLGFKGLAVRGVYECPLEKVDTFWEPPARLMVRLDNAAGTGVHFTAQGLEFDERVVALNAGTVVRAAAGVSFPRQLPLEPSENPLKLYVRRLGLKTQW